MLVSFNQASMLISLAVRKQSYVGRQSPPDPWTKVEAHDDA